MLQTTTCSQSYSIWRHTILRQLLAESHLIPQEHLLFLSPKSSHRLHQPSTRKFNTSSGKSSRAQKEGSSSHTHESDKKPQRKPSPLVRQVLSKPNIANHSISEEQTNEKDKVPQKLRKRSSQWKPTSSTGVHDLTGLAQSLKSITDAMKVEHSVTQKLLVEKSPYHLPLSPLELSMKKRKKWDPKRKPTVEEKDRLEKNPWAAMLASPLRIDSASKTRFPTALLLDVGHVKNPGDDQVYMMPNDLADLEAFKTRVQIGRRGLAIKRGINYYDPNLYMLPNRLLVAHLTSTFMDKGRSEKDPRTKAGVVSKRFSPLRWGAKSEKHNAFANASKAYWNLREERGEIDDDFGKPPEPRIDVPDIQWQATITERIPNIMRQRILIALDQTAERQNGHKEPATTYPYCFEWGSLPAVDTFELQQRSAKQTSGQTYWNDMGDIESADAVSGSSLQQGNQHDPRPPIALQPSEIPRNSPPSAFDTTDSRAWLQGSFILHLGPPSAALQSLPYREPTTGIQSENLDDMISAFSHDQYIPPMLSIGQEGHRLPVFNLPSLLGSPLHSVLAKVVLKHHQFQLNTQVMSDEPVKNSKINYCILIKSISPGCHFLAQELWQLWRYLGGRDCLAQAARETREVTSVSEKLEGDATGAAETNATTYSKATRKLVNQNKSLELSETAWKHLHHLLGLQNESRPRT